MWSRPFTWTGTSPLCWPRPVANVPQITFAPVEEELGQRMGLGRAAGSFRKWADSWVWWPRERDVGRIQPLGQILTSVPCPGGANSGAQSSATNFSSATLRSPIWAIVHYLGGKEFSIAWQHIWAPHCIWGRCIRPPISSWSLDCSGSQILFAFCISHTLSPRWRIICEILALDYAMYQYVSHVYNSWQSKTSVPVCFWLLVLKSF